jgi:hypothetical protein
VGVYACGERGKGEQDLNAVAAVKRQLAKFRGDHVRALFATRKLGAFLPFAGLR